MSKISMKDAIEVVRSLFRRLYGEEDFAKAVGIPESNLIGFSLVEAGERRCYCGNL